MRQHRHMRIAFVLVLVTAAHSAPQRATRDLRAEIPEQNVYDSQYREYNTAAVTTDTVVCSQIGRDILEKYNGSAVDAAIAAMVCVGVVNHHSTGVGGGHFATIYDYTGDSNNMTMKTIISREIAPLAADRDMFVNNTEASRKGGLSIAVPGEIAGFYEAWRIYGRVDWGLLFQPTITLCEEGFTVPRDLARACQQYESDIRADPNLSELFVKENGDLIEEGDILLNPKLGQTMRRIADDPHTFYTGSLAEDIVADIEEYDGIITLEDLAAYQTKYKDALTIALPHGQYTMSSPRPPSSGAVIEFIMQVLDGYGFMPEDIGSEEDRILTYHRIVESFKFAYAKRTHLGDEDFEEVEDLLFNLTSPTYCEHIRLQINDTSTQDIDYYGPTFDLDGDPTMGTAHMNVLAPDGSAVALTSTINLFFGSNVRGSRTGIMFNDEMDDFSTPGTKNSFGVPASPANYIIPGKMPMSSMAPSILLDKDGKVVFMSGASGGTRITTATAFVAINALWLDRDLLNSTDTARVHHQLVPNEILLEGHLEEGILNGLVAKNHNITYSSSIAVVGSIENDCPQVPNDDTFQQGCIGAVSDGRKGGAPDGF